MQVVVKVHTAIFFYPCQLLTCDVVWCTTLPHAKTWQILTGDGIQVEPSSSNQLAMKKMSLSFCGTNIVSFSSVILTSSSNVVFFYSIHTSSSLNTYASPPTSSKATSTYTGTHPSMTRIYCVVATPHSIIGSFLSFFAWLISTMRYTGMIDSTPSTISETTPPSLRE